MQRIDPDQASAPPYEPQGVTQAASGKMQHTWGILERLKVATKKVERGSRVLDDAHMPD